MNRTTTNLGAQENLEAIERRLAGTLKPVTPSRELIHRLRGRIRIPDRSEIASRLRDWETLLLVLGGVLSGALVLITVARALFHLVGRRNVA
ncbi:MAG TPA: hypothetical protein VIU38_00465 [Anaerolineales bacterium]